MSCKGGKKWGEFECPCGCARTTAFGNRAYLEYASERQNEARGRAYEEDSGDVEAKRDGSVGNEDNGADACELKERRPTLRKGENGEVDEGADGRVIVERDERVHLETV